MKLKVFTLCFLLFFLNQPVFAGVWGYGYALAPCAEGTVNGDPKNQSHCTWVDKTLPVQYGPGQIYGTDPGHGQLGGYEKAYVPYAGTYKMVTFICYTQAVEYCTMAKAVKKLPSIKAIELSSAQTIDAQNPDFGGVSGSFAAQHASAPCWTLEDEYGVEWQTHGGDGRQCHDAQVLPETPATCYINYGADLNVDLGALERTKIPTVANATDVSVKKETIPIFCSGDASVTASIKFKFTPLNVNGNDVVSTTSPHLGVAIFYNGKQMVLGDTAKESFEPGYTNVELKFEAVREPNVSFKEIPTGDFKANAVMIMTEL